MGYMEQTFYAFGTEQLGYTESIMGDEFARTLYLNYLATKYGTASTAYQEYSSEIETTANPNPNALFYA
jgi:hypothetical protein